MNKILFCLIIILATAININSQSKEDIKRKISTILKQEKYNYLEQEILKQNDNNKFLEYIKNILDKIISLIQKIWKKLPILIILFLILISAGILLLIYFIIKKIDFSLKSSKKTETIIKNEKGHFNYQKELNLAQNFYLEKNYKSAVSTSLNALWLFYYHKKIIIYNKSITNREYLSGIKDTKFYDFVSNIVLDAEKIVYFKEKVNEEECIDIFKKVENLIS